MKSNWFRRMLAGVLTAALCCGMMTGCGKQENSSKNAAKTTLRILVSNEENYAVSNAKHKFRIQHSDVDVEVSIFQKYSEDLNELKTMWSRQMAGDGADIVVMDDFAFAQICDYNKVQQANAFIDLAPYFDNDPDWSWDGYSKAVADGMKMGDKQYLFPLYFQLTTLLTTDDLLAKSGVNPEKCKTGIDLMEELAKCEQELQAQGSESSATAVLSFYPLQDVFDVNPVSFDSGKGEVAFTEDFDSVFMAYDALAQQLDYYNKPDSGRFTWKYYTRLIDESEYFVVANNLYNTFEGLNMLASSGKYPVILPVYTADGSGITAKATAAVGISTGCKTPDLAYDFLKCLLCDDAQEMRVYNDGGISYITMNQMTLPIKKSALSQAVAGHKGFFETVRDADGNEIEVNGSMYVDQYNALADQVVYTYMDSSFSPNVYTYFFPYFKRTQSYENCYEDAETQLTIYATE